jgi:hypothetical protein
MKKAGGAPARLRHYTASIGEQKRQAQPEGCACRIHDIQLLGFYRFGDHLVQHDLKGFGMATPAMNDEILAIALPTTVIETHGMIIVTAVELHRELGEAKTVTLSGISLRFFDLVDIAAVHKFVSFWGIGFGQRTKKHAASNSTRAFKGCSGLNFLLLRS